MLRLDTTDKTAVSTFIEKQSPDLVVFCAGLTGTDACEKDKNAAFETNVNGTKTVCRGNLLQGCLFFNRLRFRWRKGMLLGTGSPNPVNFYGHTKLLAELAVFCPIPTTL